MLALLAALGLAGCLPPPSDVQRIADAERHEVAGAGPSERVRLPDAWNAAGRSGTWVYRSEFRGPAVAGEAWGLYLPRGGNRLRVVLNGQEVGALGRFGDERYDHAQQAHYFHLAPASLRAGTNRLEVTVQGERARYAGLSALLVGPAESTRPLFLWRLAVQTWGSFGIICVAVVFALVSGALALAQRDRSFAVFAAACVFCAIKTSWAVVTTMPFDYHWWSWLTDTSYAAYLACLCVFSVGVLQLRHRWTTWATVALAGATAVLVPLHAFGRSAAARQAWTSAMVVYAFALCVLVVWTWWRRRTTAAAVMGIAGSLSVALALYDHLLVFYSRDGFSGFALARYSLLVFLVAMGWLLVDHYGRTAREEAAMRSMVESELERKRQELEAQFDLQQKLLAEQAQQHERRRILLDIHDGMGFQLNGLLGLVERGALRRDELSREVRTAIDHMRMLVDSTETFDGDIAMLLGQLRYQIERRLQQAQVAVRWQAQLQQPRRNLLPQHAIALQRMMFELTTNAIRHARARTVTIATGDSEGGLQLQFDDDGCGFDAEGMERGHGLDSIARRAAEMGGRADISSRPGAGTRWRIALPPSVFDAAG